MTRLMHQLQAAGLTVDGRRGPSLLWSAWDGEVLILARHGAVVVRIEDGARRVEMTMTGEPDAAMVRRMVQHVRAAWAVLGGV